MCKDAVLDSGYVEVSDTNGYATFQRIYYQKCANGNFYEGDMVIDPVSDTLQEGMKLTNRNSTKKWPNGVVFYKFDSTFKRQGQKDTVRKAMNTINLKTDIAFLYEDREGMEIKSVVITAIKDEFKSKIGYGPKDTMWVNLNYHDKKEIHGRIMHEILHILGFVHEQSRYDWSNYIKINWADIKEDEKGNFDTTIKGNNSTVYGPYDFGSIMHYSPFQSSKNGNPTITPLPQYAGQAKIMGQRDSLSPQDVKGIRILYKTN